MNIVSWFDNNGTRMTKSTGSQIASFGNINRLIITSQSTINNELLLRYTNLNELYVENLDKSFYLLFNDITPFIDMSKMTAFSIVQWRSKINVNVFVQAMLSMYHLCYIRLPFALLKLLSVYCRPNIDRLEIQ